MVMADVTMCKYHVPGDDYGMQQIPAGYDSCFAKARTGEVRNNEMIIYRISQASLHFYLKP
jgi:hypothetical protein